MTSNIDASSFSLIKIASSSSINEIMDTIEPLKTSKVYDSLWADLMTMLRYPIQPIMPGREAFYEIFSSYAQKWYKDDKHIYDKQCVSMINNVYQRKAEWKKFPRLTFQLKRYQQGYKRKVSKTFALCEFQAFMRMELKGPNWTITKASV